MPRILITLDNLGHNAKSVPEIASALHAVLEATLGPEAEIQAQALSEDQWVSTLASNLDLPTPGEALQPWCFAVLNALFDCEARPSTNSDWETVQLVSFSRPERDLKHGMATVRPFYLDADDYEVPCYQAYLRFSPKQ